MSEFRHKDEWTLHADSKKFRVTVVHWTREVPQCYSFSDEGRTTGMSTPGSIRATLSSRSSPVTICGSQLRKRCRSTVAAPI